MTSVYIDVDDYLEDASTQSLKRELESRFESFSEPEILDYDIYQCLTNIENILDSLNHNNLSRFIFELKRSYYPMVNYRESSIMQFKKGSKL
jgi:hypothetical protein